MIPYDEKKIAEKTGFPVDTVVVAFGLFRKLGLIFYGQDGSIVLPDVPDITGSETNDAIRQRRCRERKKLLELGMSETVTKSQNSVTKSRENVTKSQNGVTLSPTMSERFSEENANVTMSHTMSQNCHLQCPENVTKTATNGLTCDNVTYNVAKNVTLEKEIDKCSSLSSLKEKQERESDPESQAAEKEVIDLYRNNVSPMMGEIEFERLTDCIGHYGPVWTKDAIVTAVSKGKRSLAYIEGILKNWEVDGHGKSGNRTGQRRVQRKARKVTDGSETDWDAEAGKGWDD